MESNSTKWANLRRETCVGLGRVFIVVQKLSLLLQVDDNVNDYDEHSVVPVKDQ